MGAPAATPELIGREAEVRRVVDALDVLAAGRGAILVVEGEAGVGKTALLDAALAEARRRGHPVLSGRSWELSATVPYESVVAAVARYLRSVPPDQARALTDGLPTLGALIDGLGLTPPTVAPDAFKVRAQDALATLLSRVGTPQPAVLALDDFHWADQASLEVLQYVCLDLPDAPLLIVVTIRPEELDLRPDLRRFVASLRRMPPASLVRLTRLDRGAVERILHQRLGSPCTSRVVELVASRSGGTPLLVHELVDDLVEREIIGPRNGLWQLVNEGAPVARSANDLLAARLGRLDPNERRALDVVALSDGPTPMAVVATVAGSDPAAVDQTLRHLEQLRLVRRQDAGEWVLDHPVIGHVVEQQLSDTERQVMHGRLLDAQPHAPIGRRARHASLAGPPANPDATAALLSAAGAEAMARATPGAAIAPLRAALAILPEDHPLRTRVQQDLGVAHLHKLETDAALGQLWPAWRRALERDDVDTLAALLPHLDLAEFHAGRLGLDGDSAAQLLERIVRLERWDLATVVAWTHLNRSGRTRSDESLEAARAIVALIPPEHHGGEVEAFSQVVASYWGDTSGRDCGEWVAYYLDGSMRLADHPGASHRFLLMAFDHAILSGDHELVARCLAAHQEHEQRTGQPPSWRWPAFRGLWSLAAGNGDDEGFDLRRYGPADRAAAVSSLFAAVSLRYRAGPEAALAHLGTEEAVALERNDPLARLYVRCSRLLVGLGTDAEPALAAAAATASEDVVASPVYGFLIANVPPAARALSDPAATAGIADELDALGGGRYEPSAWARLLRARRARDPAATAAELLASARILAGLGRHLEAAERVIDAATADATAVDADQLATALDTASTAGADWLVGRAERLGARRRVRAASGTDGPLTARELEVVELVAQGLTNREVASQLYISIRTVTSHLDHVYTKLGVSSREALTTWYREHP